MSYFLITLRSNQMHYYYYLKLKNYLQYIALIHYKLSLVFLKFYPTRKEMYKFGAWFQI